MTEKSIESLTLALQEIEGFALRNLKRAKAAVEGVKWLRPVGDKRILEEYVAREHEAQRIYDVIKDRVRQALE